MSHLRSLFEREWQLVAAVLVVTHLVAAAFAFSHELGLDVGECFFVLSCCAM